MADEHAFALNIEASGDVTPAPQPVPDPADTDEATPHPTEEGMTDG